jgi:hypothetical protein
MALVKRLFPRFMSSSQHAHLGRWSIEYCPTIVETRVKLANEDHCGTCTTFRKEDTASKDKKQSSALFDTYIEKNMMYQFDLMNI